MNILLSMLHSCPMRRPTLRDIRPDLRQRMRRIAGEREKMHKRLRELEISQCNLETLLAEEEKKFHDGPQLSLFDDVPCRRQLRAAKLRTFVLDALSDGRETSLSNLIALARKRGILEPQASARALNMILINLHRGGSTERLANGIWRIVKPPGKGWQSNEPRIRG
jgi:hypothetical protein